MDELHMITNQLKKLREDQMQKASEATAWTQANLALQVGVSRQTIISIEKGTYNPSLELAFKLSRALGVSIEDLFTYESDEHEP